MKDIRPELKSRLEAVRAERLASQAAYKTRDQELVTRENRLLGLLEDEERLWATLTTSANGAATTASTVPSLTVLALEFLYESRIGQPTTVVAAAAQNRGYRFAPKGAARSTNMALQGLAHRGYVRSQGGVWILTPEGRAEAEKVKRERENAILAA